VGEDDREVPSADPRSKADWKMLLPSAGPPAAVVVPDPSPATLIIPTGEFIRLPARLELPLVVLESTPPFENPTLSYNLLKRQVCMSVEGFVPGWGGCCPAPNAAEGRRPRGTKIWAELMDAILLTGVIREGDKFST
jgi:hypothetical protein